MLDISNSSDDTEKQENSYTDIVDHKKTIFNMDEVYDDDNKEEIDYYLAKNTPYVVQGKV